VRSSDEDDVTIIGAGITLHEALKAADALAEEGINARVIDLYSVKPIDAATLHAAAKATQGRIVTVEDHWPEGGIGEAVLSAFADADSALVSRSSPCATSRSRVSPWGSLTRSRCKSVESDGMRITTGWSLNDPTAANAVTAERLLSPMAVSFTRRA
jgi:Transketolase, C-terminal domain